MMLKKASLALMFLLILCGQLFAFNSQIYSYFEPVEDVFLDIESDYTYKNELQNLYDKGVVTPDQNGKFNPTKLLTRDEFVGIVMEVSCKDCIKPETALEYIAQYTGKTIFYDVKESNKFFYCIADAKENDIVKGYGDGYTCDDKTFLSGKNPFCTNNNITLEEALAVLLRNSSVFTISDNNNIIAQISAGQITADLAKDLKVKNIDGSPYTFYGYFKKALELKYEEYDIYGTLKKYPLVEVDGKGNLNPKKYVSKEEFLKMSYIISKMNACFSQKNYEAQNRSLAGKIEIYDASCSADEKNCKKSDLNTRTKTYDFSSEIQTTCSKGIKNYTWTLYNLTDGTFIVEKGKYLDNYTLKGYGVWQIRLLVEDNCGNKMELRNQVSYIDPSAQESTKNHLGVSIIANPITGYGPLKVDFDVISSGCKKCKYEWDFGNGDTSTLKNPNHVFSDTGEYNVSLVMIDENENKAYANVVIVVNQNKQDIINYINKIKNDFGEDSFIKKELNDLNILLKQGISQNEIDQKVKNINDYIETKDTLSGKINIYDKNCVEGKTNCQKADLSDENGEYDFTVDTTTACSKGIKSYTWQFNNTTTQESFQETGKYLDDYKLPGYGIWDIYTTIVDNCGNTIKIKSQIAHLNSEDAKEGSNNLSVTIEANPLTGNKPLNVDFDALVNNCAQCTFQWNFGDGKTQNGKNITHRFETNGQYEVKLTVLDQYGNKATSMVVISVLLDKNFYTNDASINTISSSIDSDKDGVYDGDDKCVTLPGEVKNSGCPVLEETCLAKSEKNTCKSGYVCSETGFCKVDTTVNADLAGSCIYPSNGSSIFGNTICDTCPCDYSIDFLSVIRRCDIIIPAITSPSKKEIYGRGEPYQVPYEYE